jgi:protein YibB
MTNTNITIVTAFYDIGRGDWTPEKGLPHYLHRSVDTYIERFSHMTKLENKIIVFSTKDMIEKLTDLFPNVDFVDFDAMNVYSDLKNTIKQIQSNPEYQNMIHPSQIKNPEYWSPEYVLVNYLKNHFVNLAIQHGLVKTDLAAWIDFGYCRDDSIIPKSKQWNYDFDVDKMHLFAYKDYQPGRPIIDIISKNDVHIGGGVIVGGVKAWPEFQKAMEQALDTLFKHGLVDDDQTIMLISSLIKPEIFEIHKIPDHQVGLSPFVMFDTYNSTKD